MPIIEDNVQILLKDPKKYFHKSYKNFKRFGGPSVYFHNECLKECRDNFLSERHIELVYATLTAWGMHRMGISSTKLVDWEDFRESILNFSDKWKCLNTDKYKMTSMTKFEYADLIQTIEDDYYLLNLSTSNQSIVVNSKALFHLFPELFPPIDRQYTKRFFCHKKDKWLNDSGNFRTVNLPSTPQTQFNLFKSLCVEIKKMSEKLSCYLEQEKSENCVTAPKAIDNAIVNYVKIQSEK